MVRGRAVFTLSGLILFSLLIAGCEAPRPVQLLVGDQQLAALYWEPPRRMSPAVLLLPAEGEKKEDWIPLATRLRQEGYGVLALDWSEHDPADREALLADARAGFEFLRAQKNIDAARIGLIGAELGADAAVFFAAREPLARLVIALTPTLDDQVPRAAAEPALPNDGFRPLLLVAAAEDPRGSVAAGRLANSAPGEAEAWHFAGSAGRGLELLSPSVTNDIAKFLKKHL